MMYFRIYDWMLHGLGLRGNELLVYAYLYMWHESGKEVYLHQWQMAKEIGLQNSHFSATVKRLRERGLVGCENGNMVCYGIGNEKVTESVTPSYGIGNKSYGIGNKKVTESVTPSYGIGNSTINKNINKNKNNVDVDARAHTRESEKLEEMAIMGVVEDIRQLAEEVKEEISNGGTIAESARRLYALNGEQLSEYVDYFVDWVAMRGETLKSRSDFRRHFNAWLRIQLSEKNKNQQNGAKNNGINDGGEGNARISAGYVQELMRKAGLAIQSGGNK